MHCVFVFDTDILKELPAQDRRVALIRESLVELDHLIRQAAVQAGVEAKLASQAGLIVLHGRPLQEIAQLAKQLEVQAVFANHDDEPFALARDAQIRGALANAGVALHTYKDHVVFERQEVLTLAGNPYTVFTPYKNAWLKKIQPQDLAPHPVAEHAAALAPRPKAFQAAVPTLPDIDFENIDRRTIPLPIPKRNYGAILAGPSGTAFVLEFVPNKPSVLHKFTLESKEAKEFATGLGAISISQDGKKMLANGMGSWRVINTGGPNGSDAKVLKTDLRMQLDRNEEWKQIFEETWRYERDYFYAPNIHGRNWNEVYERYAPLVPFVKHRADLNYILDQVNGELSVGHSFVSGGDIPETDNSTAGMLGADLVMEQGRWKIARIYNTESWNPGLSSPLDRPGIKAKVGDYIVGINGRELTSADDPYQYLDGTADIQTSLHINSKPVFEGSWIEIVKPIRNENALRQRAWVEDNRRMVDSLSGGKLAYIWVPNTGGGGFVSFNRYYFAQQDKLGAVIDERFNGGGLLDDYMVDLMTRSLRAALTNEVPNGTPMRLPAGILGPKVLLINELAGSGGDFFPWVFRQQKAGLLIGARTWGGLVKS
ncbi:MAG: deoxyribodipyrimidine photo-lyase, partial [Rhodoferax sp.]